jgi:hypothetical protein
MASRALHPPQEYVDEAKAQAQEARDKMAMIDAKITQVKEMAAAA